MYRYLVVLTIAATVGLQAWRTLFNNFAVDLAGLDGDHIGVIQSVRGYVWRDVHHIPCDDLRSIPDGVPIPLDAGPPPQP